MTRAITRAHHSHFDLFNHGDLGYSAFWTSLRQARLCPNCDAVFDSSFTYCPCCGAQHLFDTVPLGQVLNSSEMIADEHGYIRRVPSKDIPLKVYQDERFRDVFYASTDHRFSVRHKTEAEKLPGFFGLVWGFVKRQAFKVWWRAYGERRFGQPKKAEVVTVDAKKQEGRAKETHENGQGSVQ